MPLTDHMPTTAKVVAAVLMAALGWVGSEMFRPLMPPDTNFGMFNQVNVVLGLICGWRIMGPRAGFGYSEVVGNGLTGLAALIFWAMFLQTFNEMLKRALDNRYDGPFEALEAMLDIAVEFGQYLLNAPLIGVLVGGALLAAFIAEWASHRWS